MVVGMSNTADIDLERLDLDGWDCMAWMAI